MFPFTHGIIASNTGGAVAPLWNNLLSYYTADNTPNDAIGSNNGTLVNGATYGIGRINQGFSFDGVNDYVGLGNVLDFDGSTPFSFSAWIYPTSITSNRAIVSKINTGTIFNGFSFLLEAGKVRFYLSSSLTANDYLDVITVASVSINTFAHVSLTYDGSKSTAGTKIYINGVDSPLTIRRNTLVGSTSNSFNFLIGANNTPVAVFSGIIDEVGVWGRELTSSEVTELYNAGTGKQYPN